MSKVADAIALKNKLIRFLTLIIVLFGGLLAHAHYQVANIPEDLQCYIPPDISRGGKLLDSPPPNEVYAFVREINQQLHLCSEDCATEFPDRIDRFKLYTTPTYNQFLRQQARKDERRNSMRRRYISEFDPYSPSKVSFLGNGTYEVKLTVKETEYVGTREVRNAIVEYPYYVVLVDIDRQKNPWKMQLNGTSKTPVRLDDGKGQLIE